MTETSPILQAYKKSRSVENGKTVSFTEGVGKQNSCCCKKLRICEILRRRLTVNILMAMKSDDMGDCMEEAPPTAPPTSSGRGYFLGRPRGRG